MAPSLTDSDLQTCTDTWWALQDPCEDSDCQNSRFGCDCKSSRPVVLSFGYADVHQDGSVTVYGGVIANVGA